MKNTIVSLLLFFFSPILFAQDFGLMLNQYAGFGNGVAGDNNFEYSAGILPRFSKIINDNSSFFISAGFTLNYNNKAEFIPELLHTEFTFNSGHWELNLGCFPYTDPLGFIADGLFHGARLTHSSSLGRFGAGVWYTGLLYKRTANITMTEEDYRRYEVPLNYNNFADTYFAPRRLLASLDWEHLAIAEFLRVRGALTGQFDLSNHNEKLHSQYLTLKAGIPIESFLFELGGGIGTAQTVRGGSNNFNFSFAGDLGVFWTLPTTFFSRLSFNACTASGYTNNNFGAFAPVTNKYFGEIFQARMTSLTALALNYSARFTQTVGGSISASYFLRHDLVTVNSFPFNETGRNNFALGAEVFARLVWSPFSDLQLNIGGGAFIPALGNVWNEKPLWRIDLSAVLAVF